MEGFTPPPPPGWHAHSAGPTKIQVADIIWDTFCKIFQFVYRILPTPKLTKDSHFLKTIPLIKDYDIEAKFVNDNIIDMVEYFKKEDNVNIYVIGESPINSLIPRININ